MQLLCHLPSSFTSVTFSLCCERSGRLASLSLEGCGQTNEDEEDFHPTRGRDFLRTFWKSGENRQRYHAPQLCSLLTPVEHSSRVYPRVQTHRPTHTQLGAAMAAGSNVLFGLQRATGEGWVEGGRRGIFSCVRLSRLESWNRNVSHSPPPQYPNGLWHASCTWKYKQLL